MFGCLLGHVVVILILVLLYVTALAYLLLDERELSFILCMDG